MRIIGPVLAPGSVAPLPRPCPPRRLSALVAAFSLLFLGTTTAVALAAGPEPKRVFVLNSFNRGHAWTDNMLRGIDDTFAGSGLTIETYVRFMDTKRVPPSREYFAQFKELLRVGYAHVRFDAVLACDNDALEFVRNFRDDLFPGVPVVFSSINDYDERLLDGRRDITGTSENTDYTGTIRLALKLRPATKTVVIVTDDTTAGKAHRSAVEKSRPEFAPRVAFTYLSLGAMTLDELREKLSQLGDDSVVLLLQHFVDRNGTTYTVQQSTPLITASCPVPVFVLADIRLGLGVLGGDVGSGYHHGEAAARMVVKILEGTAVAAIPVLLDSPNKYMFDYSVMRRFGIVESSLPPGSIVINKPVAVLDRYRGELLLIFCVFVVLCASVVFLLVQIARRRRTEEQLRASENRATAMLERLNLATRAASLGIWDWDIQQNELTWDDRMYALYGVKPEQFGGAYEVWLAGVHPDDRAASDEASRQTLRGERDYDTEFRVVWPDGTVRILKAYGIVVRDAGGKPLRMTGFNFDITEHRQAEAALRESEGKYRDLFDNAEVAMFRTRLDGSEVLDVNRKFLELVGKTREETLGKPSSILWVDPEEREKMVRRLVADGSVSDLEFQMLNEQRGVRDCVTSLRLYPEQGILIGSIADITEKKRLAGEKAKLEDQLRQAQKVEAIGRLAGGVAHDFNNMTAIILGYGEMLLGRLGPEDPARKWAEQIVEAGRRSTTLTRQLLAFCRRQVLLPVVLDLNGLLRNLESMLGRLIGENIALVFDLAGDLGRVTVDPGQIEQVVINLAINARDAMPQGGNLVIETANVELDETYAKAHAETVPGDYVMLALTDNGCGMDKVHLARLFEPFFTTKEMGKGTGLGLATSYGIVKQSGGYIWAYSEPGRGTTFKIYLPRTEAQTAAAAVDAGGEAPRGRGERILLVEDEGSLREMWTIILSRLGYRVSTAGSGPGALALIMETGPRPDLVITDVIMPCMSGAEMVQRFRKNWPELKVLYMSGYPDEAITSHGVLDPGISFIQKPFSERAIARKVREVLGADTAIAPPGRRVLMVDDDEQYRELVRHFCAKQRHSFAGVASAARALDELGKQPFDILLVDLNIPGTSGEQVLREIRAAGNKAPAIVLTGDLASADMAALRPLGVVQALEKSSNAEALLQAIEGTIKRAEAL